MHANGSEVKRRDLLNPSQDLALCSGQSFGF
jgi:hypothetical protein